MSGSRRFMKKYGQVYLANDLILSRELEILSPLPGEHILEIGPGHGEITERILAIGSEVTALELDPGLVSYLSAKLSDYERSGQLELINMSFLDFEPGRYDAVIGNIPYYITSPIFFKLYDFDFLRAVLMVQREVAGRAIAKPGSSNYSRFSINCYLRYEVEKILDVPSFHFRPEPSVDSSILLLKKKNILSTEELKRLDELLKRAFSQRRKILKNTVPEAPPEMLKKRPQELSPEDYLRIQSEIY